MAFSKVFWDILGVTDLKQVNGIFRHRYIRLLTAIVAYIVVCVLLLFVIYHSEATVTTSSMDAYCKAPLVHALIPKRKKKKKDRGIPSHSDTLL